MWVRVLSFRLSAWNFIFLRFLLLGFWYSCCMLLTFEVFASGKFFLIIIIFFLGVLFKFLLLPLFWLLGVQFVYFNLNIFCYVLRICEPFYLCWLLLKVFVGYAFVFYSLDFYANATWSLFNELLFVAGPVRLLTFNWIVRVPRLLPAPPLSILFPCA